MRAALPKLTSLGFSLALLHCSAWADVVLYTAAPGSYPAVASGLVQEFGTNGFPPNTETALPYYEVPGTGTVFLTFRFKAETGSFLFNFGLYHYTPELGAIDLSTTTGKIAYATQALAPGNAMLVFDDRFDNPGTNRVVSVNGGDLLGFFLIPDATLLQFRSDLSSFAVNGVGSVTLGYPGLNRWPLFGLAEANPGERDQLMSFAGTSAATGRPSSLFAWEDLTRATIDGNTIPSDNAFNDLIFGVEGVSDAGSSLVILQRPPEINYVRPASNIVLQVIAVGQEPIQYQWFFNQTNALAHATNATYAITNAQPEQEGVYSVRVSNPSNAILISNVFLALLIDKPSITGQWDFDQGNLSATVGFPLAFMGGANGPTAAGTQFGSTTSFGIPDLNGLPAQVLRLGGALNNQIGYIARHGAVPNGDIAAAKVNRWTLLLDILIPNSSGAAWFSFMQIDDLANSNDGDLFAFFSGGVAGLGISGQYQGALTAGSWHRVAFAVDAAATLSKYIDGIKVGDQTSWDGRGLDGRHALLPTALLFADDNGESRLAYVNSIQFRNYRMSDAEIAALGGPSAGGLPQPPTLTAQPVSLTVVRGQTASFTVGASGTQPLSYRWRRDGVNIPGATLSTYTISNAQSSQAGGYSVVVSNAAGSVTSIVAVLTVEVPCLPEPSGLVAWWSGEGNLRDAVNSLDGTILGEVRYTNGFVGQGLYFAGGPNDVIEVPDNPLLDFATNAPITVEMWLYRIGPNPIQHFLGKRIGCNNSQINYQIWVGGIGNRLIFCGDSSCADTGLDLPLQTWTHLAGTFDGQTMRTYVNGVLRANVSSRLGAPNSGPLRIGGSGSCGTFRGIIDEVAIFNRALTANEIAALFAAGSAGICPKPISVLINGQVPASSEVAAFNQAFVSIETLFPNGHILYTLNGAPPGTGRFYTGTFLVNETVLVRAIAYSADYSQAAEAAPVTLTVVSAPVITVQPKSQSALVGEQTLLTVAAAGSAPLSHQWFFNGVALPGQTNSILGLINLAPSQAGDYFAAVSNPYGAVTSAVARLGVLMLPDITQPPLSTNVGPGATVMFCVLATGSEPLRYQWRRNGADVPGATNDCLTLTNVQPSDGGLYTVLVANEAGVAASGPAGLSVSAPTIPPGDFFTNRVVLTGMTNVLKGANASATREAGEPFHAGKVGSNSVWYAWTAPASGVVRLRTSGSTFDTLLAIYTGPVVSNLTQVVSDEDQGGFYASEVRFNATANTEYVIAIDGLGGQGGVFVLSLELEATVETVPRITVQPTNQVVRLGASNVAFAVVAEGQNLSYRWMLNGGPIAGATDATLVLSNVQPADLGGYMARVSSGARSVDSQAAVLEIGGGSAVSSQDKVEDLFFRVGGGGAELFGGPGRKSKPRLASLTGGSGGYVSVSVGTSDFRMWNNSLDGSQLCERNHCEVQGGHSRWMRLRPTGSALFVIDSVGSMIDTVLAAYTNSSLQCASFMEVECDNDSGFDGVSGLMKFRATPGIDYYVAVDGVGGSQGLVTMNWALGVEPVLAAVSGPQVVQAGETVELSVMVGAANPAPSYQWWHNGGLMAGETQPNLSLSNVDAGKGGTYQVVVSNIVGRVVSPEILVTVVTPLELDFLAERVEQTLQFRLLGQPPEAVALQGTTNFLNWIPLLTNPAPHAPFEFVDPQAAIFPFRFYRLVPWP